MSAVNSVLGPVEASDLGFTLTHEHVLISWPGLKKTYPGFVATTRLLQKKASLRSRRLMTREYAL